MLLNLKNLYITASTYEKSIDKAAFKYQNDVKREPNNGDVFLKMSMRVRLDNQKDWDITIGVLPGLSTVKSGGVIEILGKNVVNDYVKFVEKNWKSIKNRT